MHRREVTPMPLHRFLAIRADIRAQAALDYATLGTLAPMTAVAVELAEELERRVVARGEALAAPTCKPSLQVQPDTEIP